MSTDRRLWRGLQRLWNALVIGALAFAWALLSADDPPHNEEE